MLGLTRYHLVGSVCVMPALLPSLQSFLQEKSPNHLSQNSPVSRQLALLCIRLLKYKQFLAHEMSKGKQKFLFAKLAICLRPTRLSGVARAFSQR